MRISDWSSDVCSSDLYVGSLLPLLRSVSGRLFLSYLPRDTTRDLLEREMQSEFVRDHLKIRADPDIAKIIAGVRRQGVAQTEELLIPGLDRKRVVSGKSVYVRQGLGGRRSNKKKTTKKK